MLTWLRCRMRIYRLNSKNLSKRNRYLNKVSTRGTGSMTEMNLLESQELWPNSVNTHDHLQTDSSTETTLWSWCDRWDRLAMRSGSRRRGTTSGMNRSLQLTGSWIWKRQSHTPDVKAAVRWGTCRRSDLISVGQLNSIKDVRGFGVLGQMIEQLRLRGQLTP